MLLLGYIMPCTAGVPNSYARVSTNVVSVHVAKPVELSFVLLSPTPGQCDLVRIKKELLVSIASPSFYIVNQYTDSIYSRVRW